MNLEKDRRYIAYIIIFALIVIGTLTFCTLREREELLICSQR